MKFRIDKSLVRVRLSLAIDLRSLLLGKLDRVGFPCALAVCAIFGIAVAQPASGKDSGVLGAPNWGYVFKVEHDDVSGRAIRVRHFIAPRSRYGPDFELGFGNDFELEFNCNGSGSAGGRLTPSSPALNLSFEIDVDESEFLRHLEASGSRSIFAVGKLDIRVDSNPPIAIEVSVGPTGNVSANRGDAQTLAEYMNGGSKMFIRLRGEPGFQDSRSFREQRIVGFEFAYAKLSRFCAQRQQLLYERADPFEWTP